MPRVRPKFFAGDARAKSGGRHEVKALNEGFLGTAAPPYADLVVLLEFGMGVTLLIGAVLARTRRFRLHAWCQSAIVLLNLVVVVLLMVPSIVLDPPSVCQKFPRGEGEFRG